MVFMMIINFKLLLIILKNDLSLVYKVITNNKKLIMIRKTKKVDYIDGHHLDDDILIPTLKNEEIMLTGTKRFHNCLHLILGLSKLERLLMDWISEEMDERNIIRNEKYVRGIFIGFIKELVIDGENKEYSDASVNNAYSALNKKGLLIPISKGVFQVNPKYYWIGSENDRIEEIMLNIQFSSTSSNFKVLKNGKEWKLTRHKK